MTTMNNEDQAEPSVHEPHELPEPAAWVRDLSGPQPHCVTSLSYRSAADAGAGVRYEPLYTADKMREAIAEWNTRSLGVALNKAMAIGEMLAAVVQGAKEEFVRVPYGASHEDVAAINDWHKMAAEALAKWENKA